MCSCDGLRHSNVTRKVLPGPQRCQALLKVEATDPVIYSGTAVIILTTGLISIGYSASVAARTEPAVHLKSE